MIHSTVDIVLSEIAQPGWQCPDCCPVEVAVFVCRDNLLDLNNQTPEPFDREP